MKNQPLPRIGIIGIIGIANYRVRAFYWLIYNLVVGG